MTDRIILREVRLREDLQLIESRLDTTVKLAWIKAQTEVGFTKIEVTCLLPLSILPQFAHAATDLMGARKSWKTTV